MILKLSKILERYPRIYRIAIKIYGLRAFNPTRLYYRSGCRCYSITKINNKYEIIFDAQCLQGLTRQRGIGTYSLSLIGAICELEPDKKFAAYLTTIAKCREIEIAKKELEALNCPNLDVVVIDPFRNGSIRSLEFVQGEISSLLTMIAPTALFNLSNFEKPKNAIPTPKLLKSKSVGILYDLIPLQFSNDFLISNAQKSTYFWQLGNLKDSELLLSISQHSMMKWRELVASDSKVRVIYGAGRMITEQNSTEIFQRAGILCVGAEQSHKNLNRFLEAYSLLETDIQDSNPLTIIGIRSMGTRKRLKAKASQLGIRLELPDYLFVDQLIHMYKTKRLLVVPSLEEGLSLPILEAWSLGLPVVGGSNTAVEEILQDRSLLFDPYSVNSIKEIVSNILSQDSFWQRAVAEIPEKIDKFSWSQTANLALKSVEEV
jgi:glycosyltransferase involved in cell wall biosynthesis